MSAKSSRSLSREPAVVEGHGGNSPRSGDPSSEVVTKQVSGKHLSSGPSSAPGTPSSNAKPTGAPRTDKLPEARNSLDPNVLVLRKPSKEGDDKHSYQKIGSIDGRESATTRLLSNANVSSSLGKAAMETNMEAINRAKAMIIGSMSIQPPQVHQAKEKDHTPKEVTLLVDDKNRKEYRGTAVPDNPNHLAGGPLFDASAVSRRSPNRGPKKVHPHPVKEASFFGDTVTPRLSHASESPRHQNKAATSTVTAKDSIILASHRALGAGMSLNPYSTDHKHENSGQRESVLGSHPLQLATSAPSKALGTEPLTPERKKRRFSDELPIQLRKPPAHDRMLQKVPIFQGCDPEFMSALASSCKKQSLSAGEHVLLDPLTLTVVCSGTVHVEIQKQLVDVLHEGQAFGEPGMLGAPNNPLLTLKVPMQDGKLAFAKICHITAKTFKAILSTHPRERARFTDLTFAVLYKGDPFINKGFFVDALKSCDWVHSVLLRCAYRKILPPQQIITREGEETPQGLIMVRSGTVVLSIGGCEIRRISSGQTIGETLLFGVSSKWSVTAICETVCDVSIMNRMTFARKIPDVQPQEMNEVQRLLGINRQNESEIHKMETKEVLFNNPIFSGSVRAFVEALNDCLEERVYMPGQIIVEAGQEQDSLYYINNGMAEEDTSMCSDSRRASNISGSRGSIRWKDNRAFLEKGSVFGVQQFLGLKTKHLTTLQARSLCPVQVLYRKVFLLVLDEFPKEPAASEVQRFLEEDIENREVDVSAGDSGVSQTVAELPLLRECTEGFVSRIWSACQRRIHPPGQKIVREGRDIEELFVINRGDATVTIDGHFIRKLEKGGYFGDVAIMDSEKPRRATVTVTCGSATESWILQRKNFQSVLEDFPDEKERFSNAAMLMVPSIVSDAQVRPRADAELRNRRCLKKAAETEQRQMSHLDFFGGCSEGFLEEIQRGMEERLYVEGEEIMKEGGDGDCMYILHRGVCEVLVGGNRLSELCEGAIIGDMCVLGLTTCRAHTVLAHGFCTVHVLHKSILDRSLDQHPDQRDHFERIALARLDGSSTETFSLPDTPFFTDCDLRLLEMLETNLQTVLYPANSVILQDGSDPESLHVLSLGDAIKESGGEEQGGFTAGDTFGAELVLGIIKKSDFSVRAKTLCVVRQISADVLLKTIQGFPNEAKMFVEDASTRMGLTLPEATMCPLFRGVNQRFTEQLAATLDFHTFLPGVLITRQGSPGSAMYFILFGDVGIEYDGQVVAGMPLGPGDSWGEMNVLGIHKTNRQSTRARSVCHLRSLTVESFDKLLKAFPGERIRFEKYAKQMKSEEAEREDIMKSQVQTVKVQKRMDGAFNNHIAVNGSAHHHNQGSAAKSEHGQISGGSPSNSPRSLGKKWGITTESKISPMHPIDRKRKTQAAWAARRHAVSMHTAVAVNSPDDNMFFSALPNVKEEGTTGNDPVGNPFKGLKSGHKLARYTTGRKNAILRGKVLRLAHQGVYLDDELRGMQRLNDEELDDLETVGMLPDQALQTMNRTQVGRDLQAMRPTPPSKEQAVQRTFSFLMGRSMRNLSKV